MKYLRRFNENLNIDIDKDEYSIKVDIIKSGDIIGYIILEKDDVGAYTITDTEIKEPYRRKGYYKKSIYELIRQEGIKVMSVFRSDSANMAWESLMKNLPNDIELEVAKRKDAPQEPPIYILSRK